MENKKNLFQNLVDKAYEHHSLIEEEILFLLENMDGSGMTYLAQRADDARREVYGDKVFLRGLVEISNYCKRQCKYCGINASNAALHRYRLTPSDILKSCQQGYDLGFRTFVFQGGEDPCFTDSLLANLIKEVKMTYPDAAITLSLGERSYASYERLYEAGADRYLLRHETINKKLYDEIHIGSSYEERIQALWNLKHIGYQIGAGFMVGIPGYTKKDLVRELLFLKELDPHMVGIGPFSPHKDTVYRKEAPGTLEDTVAMVALTRLFLPKALIPATTALASIDGRGRTLGLQAGANVVMPNLSPAEVRKDYALYDGKVSTGYEAAESLAFLEKEINKAGYIVDMSRGDNITWMRKK